MTDPQYIDDGETLHARGCVFCGSYDGIRIDGHGWKLCTSRIDGCRWALNWPAAHDEYARRVSNMLATVPREERADCGVWCEKARTGRTFEHTGDLDTARCVDCGKVHKLDHRPAEPAKRKDVDEYFGVSVYNGQSYRGRIIGAPYVVNGRTCFNAADLDSGGFVALLADSLRRPEKPEPARAEEPKTAEVSERERELIADLEEQLHAATDAHNRLYRETRECFAERDQLRAELNRSEELGRERYATIKELRAELAKAKERIAELNVRNARLTAELQTWEDWCHDQIHKTKMLKIDKRPSRDWLASVLDDILKDMASDRAEHARHHREEERLTKELEAERLSRLVAERVVELLPIDMFDRLGLDATETAELQGAIETYDRRFLASIPNSSDGIENLPPVSAQPEPKDPPGVRIRDDIRTVRAEVTPAKSSPSRAKLL